MNIFERVVAEAAERTPKPTANDYIGEDGETYCGTCHTRKTCIVNFGTEDNPKLLHVNCICQCRKNEIAAEEKARKTEKLRRACFGNDFVKTGIFENDKFPESSIGKAMRRYADSWGQMYRDGMGLLFYGAVGTGKTFYAECIANAVTEQLSSVKLVKSARLVSDVVESGYIGRADKLDSLAAFSLLILDDYGMQKNNDFFNSFMTELIDMRYEKKKPLIITTNLDIEYFKNPADMSIQRMCDRILEMCFPVKFEGMSKRRESVKSIYLERKKMLGL